MREPNVIMASIGDDPLTELMELDSIYCWSRRIHSLTSLFQKKKKSIAPYVLLFLIMIAGAVSIGAAIALAYISLS